MAKLILLASAICVLSMCGLANATTITFSGLPGPNQNAFTTYTESGFTVTAKGGMPEQGTEFGNPLPSVIIDAPVFAPVNGTVEVTRPSGRDFTFTSMDLASNNGGPSTFSAEGFLNGSLQYNFTGNVPSGSSSFFFVTETNSLHNTVPINALDITVNHGAGTTSDNLDNIGVTAVSEPSTAALLGSGLCIGAVVLRRRIRRFGRTAAS